MCWQLLRTDGVRDADGGRVEAGRSLEQGGVCTCWSRLVRERWWEEMVRRAIVEHEVWLIR